MRKSSLFWGGILLISGIIFLLDNLDIIQVDAWKIIGPLILLAFGVWILWGALSKSTLEIEHFEIPILGASSAKIKIQHGAGKLKISPTENTSWLINGNCRGGVVQEVTQNGEFHTVLLRMPSKNIPMDWIPGESLDWEIHISEQLPVSLDIETGAADVRLDLTELLVNELKYSSGASSSTILMPEKAGMTKAKVSAGAASVQINIPDGVAGKIRTQGGLSTITVNDKKFLKSGKDFISPDWEFAVNRIDLQVEVGVGSVDIR
jgi:hypothetical protein